MPQKVQKLVNRQHYSSMCNKRIFQGAGHFTPLDRPGPCLQMLYNFVTRSDYSTPLPFSTILTPLKKEYDILERVSYKSSNSYNLTKRSIQQT